LDFPEPSTNVEKTFKIFLSQKNHLIALEVSETTWHCFATAAFSGKFAFPICEHSVRRDWQVHFKKRLVYGDNFLHERGGQQFWCCVACWRERIM